MKNVLTNCIAPLSASRLTETVLPKEMLDKISPDFVVPLAVTMCHEESTLNGEIIEAGGGWFQKVRVERTQGIDLSKNCTPESLKENWAKIVDFSKDTQHP